MTVGLVILNNLLVIIRNFSLFFVNFFIVLFCHADQCVDWFKENKIFPTDKNCLNECVILPADMATFMCNLKCEKYCNKKCEIDSFWKKKIKDGRPTDWNMKSEKSKSWTKEEKEQLEQLLSTLPEQFKSLPLDGIYKMEKSVQIVNPGTMQDNAVVLYDAAFSDSPFNLENVIVHELAHVLYASMSKIDYKEYEKVMGWDDKLASVRSGPFINSKAKDNPDEDFANNVENFLLNNEKLKNKVPTAYNWIVKKFSKDFKMKDKCKNDK